MADFRRYWVRSFVWRSAFRARLGSLGSFVFRRDVRCASRWAPRLGDGGEPDRRRQIGFARQFGVFSTSAGVEAGARPLHLFASLCLSGESALRRLGLTHIGFVLANALRGAGALAVALIAGAGGAAAAEAIGRAELVHVWATGRPPGAAEHALYPRDEVFAQEALRTVEGGALHVVFEDDTRLRLGSAATVTLDEFVYDADAGAGRLAGSVARGIARFITGKVGADGFVVRTAAAAIGVRGTDFSVWVEADGRTTIWVNQGAITVTPLGGAPAGVGEGETVAVAAGGGALKRGAIRPPADPGLGEPLLIGR